MPTRSTRPATLLAALLMCAGLVACSSTDDGTGDRAGAPAEPSPTHTEPEQDAHGHGAEAVAANPSRPLRAGERRLELEMPEAYTPKAPRAPGTDDYRCFLLDPELDEDAFVTGVDVRPGNPKVVHHVILFHVPPENVAEAQTQDDAVAGQGWTCFGGTGMGGGATGLDDAPWLGAWAPGGRESIMKPGYGTKLEKGSRIVMQVHYNLLAGDGPDVSATRLRLAERAPDGKPITPVTTMLLPAPVELPCRPGHDDNELCDRDKAVADVKQRFGGSTYDLLHLLCGSPVKPSKVTTCDRPIQRATTVLGAAGHMHLLGRSITIEANPGRPDARTLLRMPVWDFDNQQARPVKPLRLEPGDEVRVTCRHDQAIRDALPAFDDIPERYVVWGEGTSDEMCLGILQVTAS